MYVYLLLLMSTVLPPNEIFNILLLAVTHGIYRALCINDSISSFTNNTMLILARKV